MVALPGGGDAAQVVARQLVARTLRVICVLSALLYSYYLINGLKTLFMFFFPFFFSTHFSQSFRLLYINRFYPSFKGQHNAL